MFISFMSNFSLNTMVTIVKSSEKNLRGFMMFQAFEEQ